LVLGSCNAEVFGSTDAASGLTRVTFYMAFASSRAPEFDSAMARTIMVVAETGSCLTVGMPGIHPSLLKPWGTDREVFEAP